MNPSFEKIALITTGVCTASMALYAVLMLQLGIW